VTTQRAYAVELTIPDNEAYTTLVTLVRLGLVCRKLERADVWVFDVDEAYADGLEPQIRNIETIFNPNKHVLRGLNAPEPRTGEVWVGERDEDAGQPRAAAIREVQLAGRVLEGVFGFRRYKGWRLWESEAEVASPAVIASAVETLLCNPAFQVALT
jgi:hypothetical protein